jgi:hypothetical protein
MKIEIFPVYLSKRYVPDSGYKFHKIENDLFFWQVQYRLKTKIWISWLRSLLFLTQKNASKLPEIWVRSGIRKILFSDLGSKGQKAPDPGSGCATLNQCLRIYNRHRYPRYLLKIQVSELHWYNADPEPAFLPKLFPDQDSAAQDAVLHNLYICLQRS